MVVRTHPLSLHDAGHGLSQNYEARHWLALMPHSKRRFRVPISALAFHVWVFSRNPDMLVR